MAAGSTEAAFSAAPQDLGCFNSSLLKAAGTTKYWNSAQIMATASTDGFWEDDPEEKVKKKILASKSKFHIGRQLQIKHLPRDVTEDEIRDLLCDFPVQSVQITSSGGGSSVARATLEDPEMLEDWDRERVFVLRGQRVPVSPTTTDMMLCVARLPLDYTEQQFTTLLSAYGEINRHFLMISEKTGDSKGYGFVEYSTKESALYAKNLLDKKHINDWILVCDWLDSSHITFDSLHSKCLFVDSLPKDFRDMSEFRKVFSSVVNPPYCQIALKNGCPQDWGLVEFSTWDAAEAAQVSLNGYSLHGQNIRMSYYIPGVRAINLYLKLLNEPGPKGTSAGLLPDPTDQVIVQSLQNLFKQNPVFAQNLQNIILGQIQANSGGDIADTQKGHVSNIPNSANHSKGVHHGNSGMTGKIHTGCRSGPVTDTKVPPPPTALKNGLQHSSPNVPNAFLKHAPLQKIPLLPNPSVGPPPANNRRISVSPLSDTASLEEDSSPTYWTRLLNQPNGYVAPVAVPPIQAENPNSTFQLPLNYVTDSTNSLPIEFQQDILNMLRNPQNLQQLFASLNSLNQSHQPSSPIPTFSYPLPLQDPGWCLGGQTMPPPRHLPPHRLSPIVTPKPLNYMEMKPPAQLYSPAWAPTFLPSPPPSHQPMFSPFSAPGLLWSQPTTPIITSPQTNPLMTPIGQKRRLLPSPEPSPEGNYIGQHSQGIGGHYADSYFKRKKKN